MPKTPDFIRNADVTNFIRKTLKLHSSREAVDEINKRFNAAIAAVLKDAAKVAKKARKKTVLSEHVGQAFDVRVGRERLEWTELLKQIIDLPASDVGKITKGVERHLKSVK